MLRVGKVRHVIRPSGHVSCSWKAGQEGELQKGHRQQPSLEGQWAAALVAAVEGRMEALQRGLTAWVYTRLRRCLEMQRMLACCDD